MATKRGSAAKRAKGREYLIVDHASLAKTVRDAIDRRHGGNRNRAAVAIGIPHTTLKGYEEKRTAAVRHETFERLHKLVGPAHSASLDSALLTPTAREILDAFDDWLHSETDVAETGARYTARELLSTVVDGDPRSQRANLFEWDARVGETEDLLSELRRRYPALWAPLNRKLLQRGHFRPRAALAFYRVVAPLLHSRDTEGVERDITELHPTELRRFLRAGIQREIILLDRDNDVRRAQLLGTEQGREDFLIERIVRESAGRRTRLGLRFFPPPMLNPERARILASARKGASHAAVPKALK